MTKKMQAKAKALFSAASLSGGQNIANCYNILNLIKLGYVRDEKTGNITCSECPYSFDQRSCYNYDDHLAVGSNCPTALRGGFTLDPCEVRNVSALNSEPNDPCHEESVNEEMNDSEDNSFSDLVYCGPKATKSSVEIQLQLLESDTTDRYAVFQERFNSFSDEVFSYDSEKECLACLGYFSFSDDPSFLQCYFCKFRHQFSSLRTLFLTHGLFSPNCNADVFATTGVPIALRMRSLNLYKNLKTYNSKWSYGDEVALKFASGGFHYNSRKNCILCRSCGLNHPLPLSFDEAPGTTCLDWHLALKPDCCIAVSLNESQTQLSESLLQNQAEVNSGSDSEYFPEPKTPRMSSKSSTNAKTTSVDYPGYVESPDFGRGSIVIGDDTTSSNDKKFALKPDDARLDLKDACDNFSLIFSESSFSYDKLSALFVDTVIAPMTKDERLNTQTVMRNCVAQMCSICLSETPSLMTVVGCGHVCACNTCAVQVRFCPICRCTVTGLRPVSLESKA